MRHLLFLDLVIESCVIKLKLFNRICNDNHIIQDRAILARKKYIYMQISMAGNRTDILMNTLEFWMNTLEKLQDANAAVRARAVGTLRRTLGLVALARNADVVVALLEDTDANVRDEALMTLRKLERATLAQHADAVVAKLVDVNEEFVRMEALKTLRKLPRFVTRGVDFEAVALRSRLLGRLAWYKCRLRLRVDRLLLYWYALPYRPSGPGHARDVASWEQMNKRSRLV